MTKDIKPKDVVTKSIVLKDKIQIVVAKPTGETILTEISAGTTSVKAVQASTQSANVTLTKKQFNGLVGRLEALERFVQSQEKANRTVTEAHTLELGIPGVAKYTFRRETTKKK